MSLVAKTQGLMQKEIHQVRTTTAHLGQRVGTAESDQKNMREQIERLEMALGAATRASLSGSFHVIRSIMSPTTIRFQRSSLRRPVKRSTSRVIALSTAIRSCRRPNGAHSLHNDT